MRDPKVDPRAGDQLHCGDTPDKTVTLRFTDACGQECIWVTTTRVTTVKNWRKWAHNAIVLKRGKA